MTASACAPTRRSACRTTRRRRASATHPAGFCLSINNEPLMRRQRPFYEDRKNPVQTLCSAPSVNTDVYIHDFSLRGAPVLGPVLKPSPFKLVPLPRAARRPSRLSLHCVGASVPRRAPGWSIPPNSGYSVNSRTQPHSRIGCSSAPAWAN